MNSAKLTNFLKSHMHQAADKLDQKYREESVESRTKGLNTDGSGGVINVIKQAVNQSPGSYKVTLSPGARPKA